ncbi:MAG: hypothetical protein WCT20_04760 [Candidatus Babeliales bacterium]
MKKLLYLILLTCFSTMVFGAENKLTIVTTASEQQPDRAKLITDYEKALEDRQFKFNRWDECRPTAELKSDEYDTALSDKLAADEELRRTAKLLTDAERQAADEEFKKKKATVAEQWRRQQATHPPRKHATPRTTPVANPSNDAADRTSLLPQDDAQIEAILSLSDPSGTGLNRDDSENPKPPSPTAAALIKLVTTKNPVTVPSDEPKAESTAKPQDKSVATQVAQFITNDHKYFSAAFGLALLLWLAYAYYRYTHDDNIDEQEMAKLDQESNGYFSKAFAWVKAHPKTALSITSGMLLTGGIFLDLK